MWVEVSCYVFIRSGYSGLLQVCDEPERRRMFNLVGLNMVCVAAEGHVPRVSPVSAAEALVQRQL